jgi:hypothetical protein
LRNQTIVAIIIIHSATPRQLNQFLITMRRPIHKGIQTNNTVSHCPPCIQELKGQNLVHFSEKNQTNGVLKFGLPFSLDKNRRWEQLERFKSEHPEKVVEKLGGTRDGPSFNELLKKKKSRRSSTDMSGDVVKDNKEDNNSNGDNNGGKDEEILAVEYATHMHVKGVKGCLYLRSHNYYSRSSSKGHHKRKHAFYREMMSPIF